MSDWNGNKKALFVTNGDSSHSQQASADWDYYATDPRAVEALLKRETFCEDNMDAIKIEQAKSDYQKIVSFIEDGSPLPPETDPYWEACAALDRLGGFIADIKGAKNTETN